MQKGEELIKKEHEASPEIQRRVNALIAHWNELLQAMQDRGKGLEEAKDILHFNEEVDKVQAWIREKVGLVPRGINREITGIFIMMRHKFVIFTECEKL